MGSPGFPGFKHIEEGINGQPKDFSYLIAHTRQTAAPTEIEWGGTCSGFPQSVIALADKVVDAVKTGAIRKFFVMAGFIGRINSYYTEFESCKDTVSSYCWL